MARFDPTTYPDRQAFEAYARRLRAAELGRCLDAVRGRLHLAVSRRPHLVPVGAAPGAGNPRASSARRSAH